MGEGEPCTVQCFSFLPFAARYRSVVPSIIGNYFAGARSQRLPQVGSFVSFLPRGKDTRRRHRNHRQYDYSIIHSKFTILPRLTVYN